jgi:4-amino-4-deoxy-L-arabinose transferase-like glycosyltransferase
MLRRWPVVSLIILWATIYVANAGYPPALLDDADTVHAEAAREMVTTGDWVTLHANGIRYLEKAPLMYWSVAAAYRVFGVNEFATRFPIALATLALALLAMMIGGRAFGERAGLYSGLMVLSCVGIFLFTRVLWPDVMLTVFISAAFYCFLQAMDDPAANRRCVYGIYVAGALAVLTKGLVGAAFPAIIILSYLLLTGEIRRLTRFRLASGTALFLLIAAPWHVAAGLANPASAMYGTPSPSQNRGFFWFYFMNEHFLRYIGKRYPQDYDTVPLALFLGLHLVWLFPWTLFLPLAVRDFPRRLRNLDRQQRVTLFLWLWAGLVILFFCFSTTQEYYTMPAYPAFAILIARALAREETQPGQKKRRLLMTVQVAITLLGLAVLVAGAIVYLKTRSITVEGDIASTLTRNPDAYALSLGHVLDLTPESMVVLRLPLIGTALAFGIGTVLSLVLRMRRLGLESNLLLAIMMAIFFFCARESLGVFEPYLSSRPLAEAITREYKDGDVIVIDGEYESGSSIGFYTRKQVQILNGRSANLEFGSYFKDAPDIFLSDDEFARLWKGSTRVFLFTDALKIGKYDDSLNHDYVVATSGGKVILTNRQTDSQ